MSESYSAFCECPGDYQSEFVRERIVKAAAKEHKCAECGGAIKKGESYQYASGKCEGDLWQVKTCARCLDLIEYMRAHVPCYCREYEGLFNDDARLSDMVGQARQTPGFAFGMLRRIAKCRRRLLST